MSTDWQPDAAIEVLHLRAQLLQRTRTFFAEREVLEVETPCISAAATSEQHLTSWQVLSPLQADKTYYLHTSPELAMKRLLAAGSGDIYQLSKVFRADEVGRRHNPEFSMLEWYRVGYHMQQLIDEVCVFIRYLLGDRFLSPAQQYTYQSAFQTFLDIDPLTASMADLKAVFIQHSEMMPPSLATKQDWLDLLMSHLIEPKLDTQRLVVITHYPAQQASLARLNATDQRVAERFEVFAGGMELANGFDELTDANEQRQRMYEDNQARQCDEQAVPVDERFLAALEHGLPQCSGVALGFDRLVMLAGDKKQIRDVLSFGFERA